MTKKEEGMAAEAARPIEEFSNDRAIHEAVLQRNGWAPGKCMTKAEYEKAVADYMDAPAGSYRGRRKK